MCRFTDIPGAFDGWVGPALLPRGEAISGRSFVALTLALVVACFESAPDGPRLLRNIFKPLLAYMQLYRS